MIRKVKLEAFAIEVRIRELEAINILGVYGWVCKEAPDTLQVADEKTAFGALKGEVAECLCCLIDRVIDELAIDPSGVIRILDLSYLSSALIA
jgi:hypothetical protein